MPTNPPFPGFEPSGETEHMQLFEDPTRRVLYALRKQGVPMPADEVESAHRSLIERPNCDASWSLIIDTRPVTGNNDPRFEAAIGRSNELLHSHFERLAVLVRSTIGKLHAERLSPTEKTYVTSEPHDALSHVLKGKAPTRL